MPHGVLHLDFGVTVTQRVCVSGDYMFAAHDNLAGGAGWQAKICKSLVRKGRECTTRLAFNDAHRTAANRITNQQASALVGPRTIRNRYLLIFDTGYRFGLRTAVYSFDDRIRRNRTQPLR